MSEKKPGVRQATDRERRIMDTAERAVMEEFRFRFESTGTITTEAHALCITEAAGRVAKGALENDVDVYRTALCDCLVHVTSALMYIHDDTLSAVLAQYAEERARQNAKFGFNVVPPLVMSCVLTEEVGEACCEIARGVRQWKALTEELVQCGAVCVKGLMLVYSFPELFARRD